ncbi:MAG: hypothetical protein RH917_13635 [Lacipirellulaceae bacterium]
MNQTRPKEIGATPGKLAIVGVLSLVLAYVLFGDAIFGSSKTAAKLKPRAAKVVQQGQTNKNPGVQSLKRIEESIVRKDWPELEIKETVKFDPFGAKLPGDRERAAIAATNSEEEVDDVSLKEIQEANEAIVIVSGGEKIARYGTMELRVGDQVGDYRVTDINNQGVVLSER